MLLSLNAIGLRLVFRTFAYTSSYFLMNESEKIERINQLYSKAAQQERRELFSKEIESLLPIENIDELKQIN